MIFAMVVATTLIVTPEPPPDLGAPAKFLERCAGAKNTPECTALAHEVNRIAVRNFIAMQGLGVTIDKTLLHTAAASSDGSLQAIALRGLSRQDFDKKDDALVIAALSSPFPGVRAEAMNLVGRLSDGSIAERLRREYGNSAGDHARRAFPYAAEVPPAEKSLGAPVYTGAAYEYFASGPKRAYFTTTDPVAKVAGFYSKGGKKAKTIAQLEAEAKAPAAQIDPAEMMRRMQSGEDPQKVVAALQANAMSKDGAGKILSVAKNVNDVSDLVAIEIVPAVVPGAGNTYGAPAVYVLIFKDQVLGKTGILFPREPASVMMLLMRNDGTKEGMEDMSFRNKTLMAPVPRTPGTDPG